MPKTTPESKPTARRGIQSIEIGFRIIDVISKSHCPIALKTIADACGLSVSNVHNYMVSFQKIGMIQQQADTGFYGLGPYALHLSMAAIEQFDIFASARPIMAELAELSGHTIFLGVWGNQGPTIVYKVEGSRSRPLFELRVGSVLPVLSSALGRNFMAHLPSAYTQAYIDNELVGLTNPQAPAYKRYSAAEIEAIRTEVLTHKLSRCRHDLMPNFTSLSAPIYDVSGEIIAALTVMAQIGVLDDALDGQTAALVIEKANAISALAGWHPR